MANLKPINPEGWRTYLESADDPNSREVSVATVQAVGPNGECVALAMAEGVRGTEHTIGIALDVQAEWLEADNYADMMDEVSNIQFNKPIVYHFQVDDQGRARLDKA